MGGGDQIAWAGDLDDDCSAKWRGLILCAEDLGGGWWWAVYRGRDEIVSVWDSDKCPATGTEARRAAEIAARLYVAKADSCA